MLSTNTLWYFVVPQGHDHGTILHTFGIVQLQMGGGFLLSDWNLYTPLGDALQEDALSHI